jgi:hypothetical protein
LSTWKTWKGTAYRKWLFNINPDDEGMLGNPFYIHEEKF